MAMADPAAALGLYFAQWGWQPEARRRVPQWVPLCAARFAQRTYVTLTVSAICKCWRRSSQPVSVLVTFLGHVWCLGPFPDSSLSLAARACMWSHFPNVNVCSSLNPLTLGFSIFHIMLCQYVPSLVCGLSSGGLLDRWLTACFKPHLFLLDHSASDHSIMTSTQWWPAACMALIPALAFVDAAAVSAEEKTMCF